MQILNSRAGQWSRNIILPADVSQAFPPIDRSAQLTSRELRRLVAEMID